MEKKSDRKEGREETFYNIKYDRITKIKGKYGKKYGTVIKTQYQQEKAKQQKSVQKQNAVDFKKLVKEIRGRYNEREELTQIKNRKNSQNIVQFAHKVKIIDSEISGKLTTLEEKLKNIQIEQSIIKSTPLLSQESSVSISQHNSFHPPNQESEFRSQHSKEKSEQIYVEVQKESSELLGNLKKGVEYTKEFSQLIHRLKDQIDLDHQFTNYLLTIPKVQQQRIKQYIKRKYPSANINYFDVSPLQIDPLAKFDVRETKNEQNFAQKLYDAYKKIDQHYRQKLHKKYEIETIETLIRELGEGELSIGHIVSYINMRTGKEFRNRYLLKMLRRIGMEGNMVDIRRLYISLTKQ